MFHEIIVTREASIYQQHSKLCISSEQDIKVPIEDVDVLLIENRAVRITQHVISSLVENGSLILMCNEKHLPSAVVLPINNHCRKLSVLKLQINQSKVRVKHLWQSIVRQKIKNQGACLQLLGIEDNVSKLSDYVTSNDNNNFESIAAARYFKSLFGPDFLRRVECDVNAVLNYGYALIRSSISRYLCIHGLEPALGIFHHSELNAFNLSDDLFEPFRPVVDLFVGQRLCGGNVVVLDVETKAELVQLLSSNVLINGEVQSVNNAIDLMVESLIRYYRNETDVVYFPRLMFPQLHKYE